MASHSASPRSLLSLDITCACRFLYYIDICQLTIARRSFTHHALPYQLKHDADDRSNCLDLGLVI